MPRILSLLLWKTQLGHYLVTKFSKSLCKQFILYHCFILWSLFLEILGWAPSTQTFWIFLPESGVNMSQTKFIQFPTLRKSLVLCQLGVYLQLRTMSVCLFFTPISSVDHHFSWSEDRSKVSSLRDILYVVYGCNNLYFGFGYFGLGSTRYNTLTCNVYLYAQTFIWWKKLKAQIYSIAWSSASNRW